MGTTGAIEIIKRGDNVVLPVTSSHAVLLNETSPDTIPGNTLAAKLGEIDNSLGKKQDKLTTIGDLRILKQDNSTNYVIQHNNSLGTEVGKETLLLIFDIDKHGHITNRRNATPEDLAKTGTAFLRFVGNYNPKITYSYGDICVINGDKPSDVSLEDGDFIIMGTTGKWSSWQANITPNIQLNNGTVHIYGTGGETNIYAPTELGENGKILGTDGTKLTWMDYPNLKLPSLWAGKDSNGTFITYNRSNVYLQGDDYISVNLVNSSKIKFSLNSDKLKTSGISFNVSGDNATLSSGGLSVTLTGDNVSFSNDNGNLKLTANKPGAGIGLTYEGNTLKANLKLTLGSISKGNLVTVTTQLGTSDGGKDAAIFGSTAFTITGDNNIKIGNGESAITLSTNGLVKSDELNSLSTSLNTDLTNEIKARKAADTELDSRINTLKTSVDSMNNAYPHIINEIYGDGTTNDWDLDKNSRIDILANNTQAALKEMWGENHNYDWNKSSRIDNLESLVTSISTSYPYITEEIWGKNHNWDWAQASRIDKLGNAFNWGLRFSDGIILAPHNNGIIVPYGTTEKIYLPKCGVCWVGYTLVSKAPITITVGGISVSLKGELYVVNKDDENNKFYMRRVAGLKTILSEPYLTIKSSGGKAYLTDIVIYFEDGPINICSTLLTSLINNNSISKTIDAFEYDNKTNSDICKFELNNVAPGFYQFTYSIKGTKITYKIENGTPVTYYTIASLLYNIETMPDTSFTVRDTNHYYTNIDFYTKDCKLCNDIDKTVTDYTTFQAIYYIPKKQNVTLYLRTFNKGTFDVKDISFKPISWSSKADSADSADVAGEANNLVSIGSNITTTVIGGSTLIKSDSSYFNFTTDSLGDVILQYIKNNKILWTLGKNFSNTNLESIIYAPDHGWFKLDGDTMPDGVFTSINSGNAQNILLGYLNTNLINTLYKGTDNRYYENNTGTLILNSYAKKITKQPNSIGEEYYMKITPMVTGILMITTGYYIKNSTGVYTWVDEPLIQG